MSFTAIIAALFLAAALAPAAVHASASDQAVPTHDRSDPVDLGISEGKLSGQFNNRPLVEILDVIGGQAGFTYQGDEEVLNQPVSGNFEGRPLIDAMEWILEPFNYIIDFTGNGEIEGLHIISLRHKAATVAPAPARLPAKMSSPEHVFGPELDELAESDLASEVLLLFETADQQLGPPPELLEYFEPVPEPGSEETGPQLPPGMVVKGLPDFEPVPKPGSEETGPQLPPGMVVKDLPGFEPVVSDTDPPVNPFGPDRLPPAAPR